MPYTTTQTGPRSQSDEQEVYDRLNWLIAVNRYEAYRLSLFRNADDEWQAQFVRRPIRTERAYGLFGLLLGGLPPAAIFLRFLQETGPYSRDFSFLLIIALVMNVICMTIGRIVGLKIGRQVDAFERESWHKMILLAGFNGMCWATATGAAGGAIVFGFGAIFGAFLALPVGLLGFVFFTILHRLVARGGMIDARHFWPLACGITMSIAAFILGF